MYFLIGAFLIEECKHRSELPCTLLFSGHDDEVLDVCFDYTGQYIVTGSADGSARVYNAVTHQCICKLEGHEGEISKVRHFS